MLGFRWLRAGLLGRRPRKCFQSVRLLTSIDSCLGVQTTKTHCILVSSRGVNRQTLCPGSSLDVDPQVEIIAGFDENSKREPTGVPLWQESFVIQPRIKVDIPLPTYSQDMPTAYWGDDNCLYAPIQIYPTLFPAPPVVFGFNSNDQRKVSNSIYGFIDLADVIFL